MSYIQILSSVPGIRFIIKMSKLTWECTDVINAYNVVFETVFPDKDDISPLTLIEVQQLIDGVKDYANAVIKTVVENANETIWKQLVKMEKASLIPVEERVVVSSTAAIPSADTVVPDAPQIIAVSAPELGLKSWLIERIDDVRNWMKLIDESDMSDTICSFLVHRKEYDMVRTAKTTGYKCAQNVQLQLARAGDVEGLKWFMKSELVCVWMITEIRESAIEHGHLSIVQWSYERFPEWDNIIEVDIKYCKLAAKKGHFNIVHWYVSERMHN